MNQMLGQPATPALPADGRGVRLGRAGVALLLVPVVALLGLLARTAVVRSEHRAGAQGGGACTAQDCPAKDLVAARPGSALQEILSHPDIIPTHDHALLGRAAPDFELADPEGKVWNRRELLDDRPVVLIFSIGSDCASCVRQLLEINADLPLFRELGARVVAISADPPELTRRRFQQSAAIGFPILSDPENKVAQTYGVFKRAEDASIANVRCLCGPRRRHATFVIDRSGAVQWVNSGDMPLRRDQALLYQLAKMEGRLPPAQSGP